MNQHTDIVIKFYTAFQQRDYKAMQAIYHPEVEFSDEVFPLLKGNEAKAMWHMLVEGGKDSGLKITFKNVCVGNGCVECDWEANYRLSLTGRNVYNKIHARFWFKDGQIIRHIDQFDFYRWARMAFGIKGAILGWAPFFRSKVREIVGRRLNYFIDKHPEYQG